MGNAGYGNHTEDHVDPEAGRTSSPEKNSGSQSGQGKQGDAPPAAGPHSQPSLTNPDATPGTGALTPPGADEGTDSVTG
ncbi:MULTISPECIES: hypothetical protein [Microvirga]|uniref:hypothetical protein n=1 Tax=Microvirga TaxID=186650 RepID=UPI001CFFE7EC|nr:hypothetical protein [Microvirga lenta]MCB5174929.1 hypothetical protein [Microvirga lenta]